MQDTRARFSRPSADTVARLSPMTTSHTASFADGFTTRKPTDSPIRPPEIDHLPVREGALDELDDVDSHIVKPTF